MKEVPLLVAGRRKHKSTSGKTTFRNEKETWTQRIIGGR